MFDAKWLVAAHLQGRDVTVVIDSVRAGEVIGEGGRKDKMPVLKLKGKDLPLGLNKTNCKTVAGMYGPDTTKWVGQAITLYPTTCRGKEGNTVDCIRIRPEIPQRQPARDVPGDAREP